jgi:ribonucleoside-diphosphate reductase beta chain
MTEFLIDEKNKRLSIFPIIYRDIYKYARLLQKMFWTHKEISFSRDIYDIKIATEGEINLIKYVLGFFLTADEKITEIIGEVSIAKFTLPEHLSFEKVKICNEQIHSETYSKAVAELFSDEMEKIYNLQDDEVIKEKLSWIKNWILKPDSDISNFIISMALFEGISFQGLFSAIFILCEEGKFPGLRLSNELISRDEGIHADCYIHLYKNYIKNKIHPKYIHKMIKELIKIEDKFIEKVLKYKIVGLNEKKMKDYMRFIADDFCKKIEVLPIFNIEKNPLPVMNKLNVKRKTNFFEDRDGNYAKPEFEERVKEDDWDQEDENENF